MDKNIIDDPGKMKPGYIPSRFVDREMEREVLADSLSTKSLPNLHLYGPRGTGKSHLVRQVLRNTPTTLNTVYIPCNRYNTQYKALKQLFQAISNDDIGNGYHTSLLQRQIAQRTDVTKTVVVLDEIDFLLLNDGDDLLYYLSRLEHSSRISVVTISSNYPDLANHVEPRTYSSLQPKQIRFEPYASEEIYRILVDRARNGLTPDSVEQAAVAYIANQTQNAQLALAWLRTAAEQADHQVTEELVRDLGMTSYGNYVVEKLDNFSAHHKALCRTITELSAENQVVQTGEIYDRYLNHRNTESMDPLSQRRISDFLKDLELLNVIEADYHYGGSKGKTREIWRTEAFECMH